MTTAAIYKIKKKGYLLHANVKAASGFWITNDPIIRVPEDELDNEVLANAIKAVLDLNNDTKVPDPSNWSEFNKEILKKLGLKSLKELEGVSTLRCGLSKENGNIYITPNRHADYPDKGYINIDKGESTVVIPITSPDEVIVNGYKEALSKCK